MEHSIERETHNNMRVLFTFNKGKNDIHLDSTFNKIETRTTITKKIYGQTIWCREWTIAGKKADELPLKTAEFPGKLRSKFFELAIQSRSWPGFQRTTVTTAATKIIHRQLLLYFCLRFTFKLSDGILWNHSQYTRTQYKVFCQPPSLPFVYLTLLTVNELMRYNFRVA